MNGEYSSLDFFCDVLKPICKIFLTIFEFLKIKLKNVKLVELMKSLKKLFNYHFK